MRRLIVTLSLVGGWLALAIPTRAEVVRYRYVSDACGNAQLVPGPGGAAGERSAWLGGPTTPFSRQAIATHVIGFRHAYTGQNVNVPITFPDSTARMETIADYVQFNFTAYTIRVVFQPNGAVEVVYNSGLLRPIAFQ